jgi:hypothetical protein
MAGTSPGHDIVEISERSVAVMVALERAVLWHADILRLIVA